MCILITFITCLYAFLYYDSNNHKLQQIQQLKMQSHNLQQQLKNISQNKNVLECVKPIPYLHALIEYKLKNISSLILKTYQLDKKDKMMYHKAVIVYNNVNLDNILLIMKFLQTQLVSNICLINKLEIYKKAKYWQLQMDFTILNHYDHTCEDVNIPQFS